MFVCVRFCACVLLICPHLEQSFAHLQEVILLLVLRMGSGAGTHPENYRALIFDNYSGYYRVFISGVIITGTSGTASTSTDSFSCSNSSPSSSLLRACAY